MRKVSLRRPSRKNPISIRPSSSESGWNRRCLARDWAQFVLHSLCCIVLSGNVVTPDWFGWCPNRQIDRSTEWFKRAPETLAVDHTASNSSGNKNRYEICSLFVQVFHRLKSGVEVWRCAVCERGVEVVALRIRQGLMEPDPEPADARREGSLLNIRFCVTLNQPAPQQATQHHRSRWLRRSPAHLGIDHASHPGMIGPRTKLQVLASAEAP